ncbi:hypothetical protein SAMN02745126_04005 [Enhydrobacter aerosaccus]|uniref:Uncharacterized protein n=1 Tax=Enhydrobacter aerosaccus TaxID=225324 RepID=A0A1T4RP30_9HYPH|nr:hypothetical protein [Enhydrobacter aerosaccus]SKA17775.1 hypothetical protein SAMN02745126_04005 [Enhydrobacter aerosaccus]
MVWPAEIGDAITVLTDLSEVEEEERVRLGINDFEPTYRQVDMGRVFVVVASKAPRVALAIFGVNEHGFIWFLPSQYAVEHHGRMLADKRMCRWFIEHCFALAGPEVKTLYNGVTPEGTKIINWLKKSCGARFSNTPVPTEHNGALALPFFIDRPNHL